MNSQLKSDNLVRSYSSMRDPQTTTSSQLETLEISDLTTTFRNTSKLDLATVVTVSQAIASEIVLENLLDKLMKILLKNAGAQQGYLLTKNLDDASQEENNWTIAVSGTVADRDIKLMPSKGKELSEILPLTAIDHVARTRESLVLQDATRSTNFAEDPYIVANQTRSILCFPIIHSGKLTDILYLENNLTPGAFTQHRVEVIKMLTLQISISIENARLYEREQEKSRQLEQYLQKLQQTQAQLVQTEKISALGQLVAGVAHEVNNPINFISGNLTYARQYVLDLIKVLKLYQEEYPNPSAKIQEKIEAMDLERLMIDLPNTIHFMKRGSDRLCDIMQLLRNFSRVDKNEKQLVDIHQGIDSTLMILAHRMKENTQRKAIAVIKEYGDLPKVCCYAGPLNQVFLNLVANAIDAMDESKLNHQLEIRIKTSVVTQDLQPKDDLRNDIQFVAISIKDNGPGMTEEVRQQLFNPFFTTKSPRKGTGLGLSISHQIVVEKHQGRLRCISAPDRGAEFIIEIPT